MAPPKQLLNLPKGTRYPGSGRKRGTPNRVSVEAKTLISELVTNAQYQYKLRRDFAARKLHPTMESMVWAYYLGKPTQPIAVSGGLALDVSARVEEERRIFASLDLRDLEQLANESQALVNRAVELAQLSGNAKVTPQDVVVGVNQEDRPSESLTKEAESNKGYYDSNPDNPDAKPITPRDVEG